MSNWILPDTLTVKNSSDWLNIGCEKLGSGVVVFDLSNVKHVDSSFVAALFHWVKQFKKLNKQGKLKLLNTPSSLMTLFSLYEMTDLVSTQIDL